MMNQKKCMPVGDYFIPAIDLKPVADKVLNKYGRMRRAFLQEQKPILFWWPGADGTAVSAWVWSAENCREKSGSHHGWIAGKESGIG